MELETNWVDMTKNRINQIYKEIESLEIKEQDAEELQDADRYVTIKQQVETLDNERTELLNKLKQDSTPETVEYVPSDVPLIEATAILTDEEFEVFPGMSPN